jgi:hypothetical protein
MHKFLLIILLIPKLLVAQKSSYLIKGSFDKEQENKFVYLSIQKIDDRQEELIIVPIMDNHFSIRKEIDKKGRLFVSAFIFLDKNDKITIQEVKELKQDPDFYINQKVLVVLEDSIDIDFKFPLYQSVVKGGKLSEENIIFQKALKEGAYLEFIKDHPDSPFSLSGLRAIDRVAKYSNKLQEIDIVELYNGLSDRIKKSFEGKEFAKKYLE